MCDGGNWFLVCGTFFLSSHRTHYTLIIELSGSAATLILISELNGRRGLVPAGKHCSEAECRN